MTTQTPSKLAVSVFFPCYNEEENVERTTRAAVAACERLFDEYEVIIVNDGSKDRTGEIADHLAATIPHVRAAHNNPNRGYGGALRRGFEEARMPYVFYTDGDGQFDFEEMERLLPMMKEYDIISPYRMNRQDPLHRRINAKCWGMLVGLLFRLNLRDIDCAFKMFPRRLFEEIELHSNGALIDTEVLARAKRLGYSIGQLGVHHYPRTAGEQTGANPKVILKAFRELFSLHSMIRATGQPAGRVARAASPASSTASVASAPLVQMTPPATQMSPPVVQVAPPAARAVTDMGNTVPVTRSAGQGLASKPTSVASR